MKRILAVVLTLALVLAMAAPTFAEDKKIKIGFSIGDISNPTWVEMYKMMQERAAGLNAEVILNDAKNDPNSQVTAIENFIVSGCDAIIVHAFDLEAAVPAINKAMEAGVKVIAYDIKVENYTSSLTVENYDFGRAVGVAAAEWINANLGGKAEIGIVNFPLLPILNERVKGMSDAIEELAPESVIVQEVAGGDPAANIKAAENLFQAHPGVNVVMTTAGAFALGANEVAQAAGKVGDKFGIFCCDATTDVLNTIKAGGAIRTAIYTDVIEKGAEMVDNAVKLVKGEDVPKDIYFEMQQVTAANVDEYLAKAVK